MKRKDQYKSMCTRPKVTQNFLGIVRIEGQLRVPVDLG